MALPRAQRDPGAEIAQTVRGGLVVAVRRVLRRRQSAGRGRAAGDLADADMGLARGHGRADVDPRQIGLDQLWPQRRVEMQDRRFCRPATAQPAAPAQAQRPDGTGLGALVGEFGPRRVVAGLQCLGEDQPERGASAGRRPRHACGRQHRLDPLAPFHARHAGQQTCIAHPPPLQRRGMTAIVGREADGVEQPVTQRSRLRDLERLAEPAAGIDEVGGGADIHLALAIVADQRGPAGLQPVLRERRLAIEAAQTGLPEGFVDHQQPHRADRLGLHVEEAVMGADDDLRGLRRAASGADSRRRGNGRKGAARRRASPCSSSARSAVRPRARRRWLPQSRHISRSGVSGVGSGAVRPFQSIARRPRASKAATCSAPRSWRGTA